MASYLISTHLPAPRTLQVCRSVTHEASVIRVDNISVIHASLLLVLLNHSPALLFSELRRYKYLQRWFLQPSTYCTKNWHSKFAWLVRHVSSSGSHPSVLTSDHLHELQITRQDATGQPSWGLQLPGDCLMLCWWLKVKVAPEQCLK